MSKQQTAVEWLIKQLQEGRATFFKINDNEERIITLAGKDVVQQAKQMNKEQHSETFNQGVQWMQYHRDLVNGGAEYWDKEPSYFLEYYNETYNK